MAQRKWLFGIYSKADRRAMQRFGSSNSCEDALAAFWADDGYDIIKAFDAFMNDPTVPQPFKDAANVNVKEECAQLKREREGTDQEGECDAINTYEDIILRDESAWGPTQFWFSSENEALDEGDEEYEKLFEVTFTKLRKEQGTT